VLGFSSRRTSCHCDNPGDHIFPTGNSAITRCLQRLRVAAVRIFYWTANLTECSEHYAALPYRQCPRSQSWQVSGPVRTQRALIPIRNYGRFGCAPERSRTPERAELGRARGAVRRAYEPPLPTATTRTFNTFSLTPELFYGVAIHHHRGAQSWGSKFPKPSSSAEQPS
jgi:hypothetical protein